MLAWTIYLSLIGAVAVTLTPEKSPAVARLTALLTTIAGLGIAIAAVAHDPSGQMTTIVRAPWIPRLGIEYHLAADGISLVLVLLTGIAAVAGVLFSWNIERRVKDFFALYLLLIGAVYGVFLSFDLFMSWPLFPSIF
jgi:NADH-quinone oxidoreductase subunit M